MNVLLVDDDPIVRMLVNTAVSELGHEVAVAASGAEAWTLLGKAPPHVVLSDWVMADVDGLELCRRIRSEVARAYTYVILLTALNAKTHYSWLSRPA